MKKFLFSLAFVGLSLSTFAQKKFITDVALLMRKYNPMAGVDAAKKNVEKAKEYIDQAAVNPETMNDPKMFLYQGQVYFALTEIAMMDKMNGGTVDAKKVEEYAATAENAFKKVRELDVTKRKDNIQGMYDFFQLRYMTVISAGDQARNEYFKGSDAIKADKTLSEQEKVKKEQDLIIEKFSFSTQSYSMGLIYSAMQGKQDTTLEKFTLNSLHAVVTTLLDKKETEKAKSYALNV
ncbi:MAG: hypothetical protein EBS34_12845, partial [Flavobacteriales bacterium]|nr:hypothetical protein [Flavobacteriales bacterium]